MESFRLQIPSNTFDSSQEDKNLKTFDGEVVKGNRVVTKWGKACLPNA